MLLWVILSIVAIFDIKGREVPQRYCKAEYFAKNLPGSPNVASRTVDSYVIYAHRRFEVDDYRLLFSFVLDHSRDFVLDCEPTPYSIRYLT